MADERDCELLDGCLFFNDQMENMPKMSDVYKRNYCMRDNAQCARYIVFKAQGENRIPPDLFPSDRVRALDIISQ